LGRTKIQFCQAESLPKMRVSMLSLPGKRRFASMAVSASGERLARSSIAIAHLLVPVEIVGCERDQAQSGSELGVERFSPARAAAARADGVSARRRNAR